MVQFCSDVQQRMSCPTAHSEEEKALEHQDYTPGQGAGREETGDRFQWEIHMADILRSRFKTMTTVDLDSGRCQLMDLSRPAGPENPLTLDYAHCIQQTAANDVHPEDMEQFRDVLSLEHLREKALALTEGCEEEVCIHRRPGEPVRWTELRVIYSHRGRQTAVNILGQDITSEKRQEALRQQAMEDRSYIISSLSSLFFSTYYIDLEQDTFRPVTQLRRVKDILGSEVNCTAALQVYANHFIHPDDREEYLSVMNMQNLRQSLRWWNPYVAVEYRKLPESQTNRLEWVRATAVLARAAGDDAPKTAVYVAQDISDSKHKACKP